MTKHSYFPHTSTYISTDHNTNKQKRLYLTTAATQQTFPHTPPPHISSVEEILHRLVQLRTNKSPFLKSYLHKIDFKIHPSPLYPLCNLWTDHTGVTTLLARWIGKLAGGPQTGRSDISHDHHLRIYSSINLNVSSSHYHTSHNNHLIILFQY